MKGGSGGAERFVYFVKPIGMDGPIKIGCSEHPASRLIYLSEWSPFPLEIAAYGYGSFRDERLFHSAFAGDRTHREWFRASPMLKRVIDFVAQDGSLDRAKALLAGAMKAKPDVKVAARLHRQPQLVTEIDRFLEETGMGEYRFGLLAAKNGRLVERLRQGTTPKGKPVLVRPETEQQIRAFIAERRAPQPERTS